MAVIGPGRLKISLTASDMKNLELTCTQMGKSDPATRKVLLELLRQAKEGAGFQPKDEKLAVEVFPAKGEGCVIYITAASRPPKEGAAITPVVLVFADADNLCRGANGLYKRCQFRVDQSQLYRTGGEYRLVLYPLEHGDYLRGCFLSEYAGASYSDAVAAAVVQEHGRLILEKNAIGILWKMFGEPEKRNKNSPEQLGDGRQPG